MGQFLFVKVWDLIMASSSQNPGGDAKFIELLNRTKALAFFNSKKCRRFDEYSDNDCLQKIQGSLVGLAVGDALGAPVEFRPRQYLLANPVTDMQSGGTWGLNEGYWTDDTSMTLCLAASLIIKGGFDPYDQFQRYRRWYRDGYLSSTGNCFDIGKSTREAVVKFEKLYEKFEGELKNDKADAENRIREKFRGHKQGLRLGEDDAAGNGPLMRLAPIPCFFYKSYDDVKKHIDEATRLTHGSQKAVDACKFYAGLISYALTGKTKEELLDKNFYKDTLNLKLDPDVQKVAEGSYKVKNGYDGGIRGKGYVVESLEAALWALSNDNNSFETGVLLAVNLGDDTDTTAAIYGQLAGAIYGIKEIPTKWTSKVYKYDFIIAIANNLYAVKESTEKKSIEKKPMEKTSQFSNLDDDDAKEHGDGTYPTRHPENKGNSQTNDNNKNEDNDRNKNRSDAKKPKDDEPRRSDNNPNNNDSYSNKTEKSEKSSDKGKKGNDNAPPKDSSRNNVINE